MSSCIEMKPHGRLRLENPVLTGLREEAFARPRTYLVEANGIFFVKAHIELNFLYALAFTRGRVRLLACHLNSTCDHKVRVIPACRAGMIMDASCNVIRVRFRVRDSMSLSVGGELVARRYTPAALTLKEPSGSTSASRQFSGISERSFLIHGSNISSCGRAWAPHLGHWYLGKREACAIRR